MTLENMTFGEIVALVDALNGTSNKSDEPDVCSIDEQVYIRTVTDHFLGKVVAMERDYITLTNCSWVAETGKRLGDFLRNGVPREAEIECWPTDRQVRIMRQVICMVDSWPHDLPKGSQ